MNDSSIYLIVALLPLAAIAVVVEANPYRALILRGILGAIAALVYAVLGAADVALTEALVGTMLAMALFAIAVRSSLVLRLGVEESQKSGEDQLFKQFLDDLRPILHRYHLRLDLVSYPDQTALEQALTAKEIHALCTERSPSEAQTSDQSPPYHTVTRIQRLYRIFETEFTSPVTSLAYVNPPQTLHENLPENLPKTVEEESP